jgi:hypothetical protein
LATSGLDGFVSVWKIDEEESLNRVNLAPPVTNADPSRAGFYNQAFLIAWDPHSKSGHCALVTSHPNIRVMYW